MMNKTVQNPVFYQIIGRGYLLVQECDDGYDYTIFDNDFLEQDGGQLDCPDLEINEITKEILEDYFPDQSYQEMDTSVLEEHNTHY